MFVNGRIIEDYLTNCGCGDLAVNRIFHAINCRIDGGIDIRAVLEGQVGIDKRTVFEREMIHVTQALIAFEPTVDEGNVLGVPC